MSGRAAALEHVEPVGQQRRRFVQLVLLISGSGQQHGDHAGKRVAPAQFFIGAGQRRPQRAIRQHHLPLGQIP
ncbi:hypothetical protein ACU4GD_07885 [Cupriavidus basilensis]